jgi:hypothetical protein
MTSKLKTDVLETVSGSGTIALTSQLSGMASASVPSGSVLQMVENTRVHAQDITTTSASFVDTTLVTGVITPVSAGSKIAVRITGFVPHVNATNNRGVVWQMFKSVNGGTYVKVTAGDLDGGFYQNSSGSWYDITGYCSVFDTPTYTLGQAINYKLYFRKDHDNANAAYINHTGGVLQGGATTITSSITMTEIKG